MKNIYITGLFLVILFMSICGTGCTTIKNFMGDGFHAARLTPEKFFSEDKTMPRKKVLVAPLINLAGFKDDRVKQLTDTWITLLNKDGTLAVSPLASFVSAQSASTSSDMGITTDPALFKKAEGLGMNILVTVIQEPLTYSEKKGVIWPFNKMKGKYEISIVVNAVDIINGAVVFSVKKTEEIEMGKVQKGQQPPLDENTLDETLLRIQGNQAEALSEFLSGMEWEGKIALDEGKIRINGGADIGIAVGNVFEVLVKGAPVKSVTGKDYYTERQKAGEITVTEVSADHSFAAAQDNRTFEAGQVIRLKTK